MELSEAVESLAELLLEDATGDLEALLDNLAEAHEQEDHDELADLSGIGDPDIVELLLDGGLAPEDLLVIACTPILHMLRRSGLGARHLKRDLKHLAPSLTGAPLDLLIETSATIEDADILSAWTDCWNALDEILAAADRLTLGQTIYANIEQLTDELRELVDDVSAQVDAPAEPLERLLA